MSSPALTVNERPTVTGVSLVECHNVSLARIDAVDPDTRQSRCARTSSDNQERSRQPEPH
jgi:hypothetical protein